MKQASESWVLVLSYTYLLSYILILVVLQLYIKDAKRMSIKIHFKGYRTAHLQIYKWLMYTHNIIQKILEKKKTNKETKRK